MPAESSTTYVTVEIRLPTAEHELLKRHASPSMTAWVRGEIRKLPGGADLPPLRKAAPIERPKWPPDPLFPGGKPGPPAVQIATFVAGVRGLHQDNLLWKRWEPVHGLYQGLCLILARGDGVKSVWRAANRWRRDGEPPHPSREFYEALFKFWDLKPLVKAWYDKKYKISNVKRERAKQNKGPEVFLARQREYTADWRARKKASAAAQEKVARERAIHDAFVSDHVTEHGAPAEPWPVAAE